MEKLELEGKHGLYKFKGIHALPLEEFKEYPNNPQYLVSNLGRIKSKEKTVNHNYGGRAIKKARILTQIDNGSGYLSVGLTKDGKTKTERVSRIVALTWVDNPENKPQVNHVDGIKYNNIAQNLEWCTSGENIRHAHKSGLSKNRASFVYIQDRLREINPYITYNPKVITPVGIGRVIIDDVSYRIEYENDRFENLVKSIRLWKDDFKMVVRPLSDLTKEIIHKGKKFVPLIELAKLNMKRENWKVFKKGKNKVVCEGWEFSYYQKSFMMDGRPEIDQMRFFNKLFQWHFDVFGLIEKGLAIDINTI